MGFARRSRPMLRSDAPSSAKPQIEQPYYRAQYKKTRTTRSITLPETQTDSLLTEKDPNPVEIQHADNPSPILLVCDHAGFAVPLSLQDRMPAPDEMVRHIAVDVGARALAQHVATQLGSTLIMQRYSRLVIDMNRPHESSELCPEVSDETVIDFNQALTEQDKSIRIKKIFQPYHDTIAAMLDDRVHQCTALVAIHSFTPKLRNQAPRPWHADLISRTSVNLAVELRDILHTKRPELNLGVNEIFGVSDASDYTLRTHAEQRDLLGLSIEVRNDLLATDVAIADWGNLLADCLKTVFADHLQNQECE